MKTVVQRVSHASVSVADREIGSIEQGALIFIGVGQQDTEQDVENLVDKIVNLRMFEDRQGKMNFSLLDKQGQVLIISQFTLCADTKKGRRPAFNKAASPEKAEQLYNLFVAKIREKGIKTETGSFGAYMQVSSQNDGPVTFILDTE